MSTPSPSPAAQTGGGISIANLADQQTAGQARVIDPILSTVARGYKFEMFAFPHLFPIVSVGQRGGTIITFGTEEFRKRDIARAPGADVEAVQFGYSGAKYSLTQRALAGMAPLELIEESSAVPGIALGRMVQMKTMQAVGLQIELAAAAIATDSGKYDADHTVALVGAAKWSNDASDPIRAIEEAKEKIAEGIGIEPNILIIGTQAWRALRIHDKIRREVYNTQAASTVTKEQVASILDVPMIVIARARYQSAAGENFVNAWGNHAILAYSDVSGLADMGSPSFGYTYRLMGYPNSFVPYYNESKNSWMYPVFCEDEPIIAGAAAGFLWSNVG